MCVLKKIILQRTGWIQLTLGSKASQEAPAGIIKERDSGGLSLSNNFGNREVLLKYNS